MNIDLKKSDDLAKVKVGGKKVCPGTTIFLFCFTNKELFI